MNLILGGICFVLFFEAFYVRDTYVYWFLELLIILGY